MRIYDYMEQAFTNIRKRKLRTFLTTFGVVIGIGALVSMMAFGQGMQNKIRDQFKELGLMNYVTVSPRGMGMMDPDQPRRGPRSRRFGGQGEEAVKLNEEMLAKIGEIDGVEWVFPEVRFPATVRFNGEEKFSYIQALPLDACNSELVKLAYGKAFTEAEPNGLVISEGFLRSMDFNEPESAVGMQIEVGTLTIDINSLNPAMIGGMLGGGQMPFDTQGHFFTIVGVVKSSDFGGPGMLASDVFIPIEASEKMNKVEVTSIEDLFSKDDDEKTYSSARVKVSSVDKVDAVKEEIEKLKLGTFAIADMLKGIGIAFLLMDVFLFGISMIALTVASLGIVNTMVMSIMERYREIGIMKAIGAGDDDVKKIIFFETAVIGFAGGVFGLLLGWMVSMVINLVVNQILSRQGAPYMNCFSFPWWLCLGAIAFSIIVSLAAGIYPAIRASKVDPVVALRHD